MTKFNINTWRKKAMSLYGKTRGLTKQQKAKVTAQTPGSLTYKTTKPKTTKKVKSKATQKRVGKTMAKKKTRKRPKTTIPLSVVVPLAGTFMAPPRPGWGSILSFLKAGDINAAGTAAMYGWTGYDPTQGKFIGFPPFVIWTLVGGLMHKIAGMLGVNRTLGRARVPYVRV